MDAREVRAPELPPASLDTLQQLRTENCASTTKDFKLQSFQLFLRRILSPDSPTRNMLLFHGTGYGKTCTAIQIAEEYILKPEFQEKKVLVLASAAIQENFRTQVFDVSRVRMDDGILMSQQCTGRRYLDMLKRAQTEGLRWENPENREKLNSIVQNMIDDFYEFKAYQSWGNQHERVKLTMSPADYAKWIHDTYDNRLVIVDEAHNLREDEESNKSVSDALTQIAKVAKGMTLVCLSATPMFDRFEEIIFFYNLFMWNDHRQAPSQTVRAADIFKKDGTFVSPDAENQFRTWCHEYISFLRGENPFTFPFRIPPPENMIGAFDRTTDIKGKAIAKPRKYLPLTVSLLQSPQKEVVESIVGKLGDSTGPTIVVSPDDRPLQKCFEKGSDQSKYLFKYASGIPPFLSASNLPKYAAKFATIMQCITETSGIVFVYSNLIRGGIQQFAMALEEAGFEPALGPRMLETTSGEYTGALRGKYAFLTSDMREKQIEQLIRRLRRSENARGQDIRVILGSPLVSEGIDFRNVRQIHILDPWYNMSRMEQVIGRGLRTCSHARLPFEEQNCTVYLHTTRYADSTQETYDEYMYRIYIEEKASTIAKIKRIISESSVDCTSQLAANMMPDTWRALPVPQRRSQDNTEIVLPLSAMSAPTFEDGTPALVCTRFDKPTEEYVRPLGAYLDIRDEVFDNVIQMFKEKPIWSYDDLLGSKQLKYAPNVVEFLLQDAIHTHLKLKDKSGRIGVLENREGMYAFTPELENPTMVERSSTDKAVNRAAVPIEPDEVEPEPEPKGEFTPDDLLSEYPFPFDASKFSDEIKLWTILDQKIPRVDKIELFKQRGDAIWTRDAIIEGPDFVAMSPSEIFNADNELVEPVGTEKDAVKLWVNTHIERIVEEVKNNKIMCTVESQTLKFAAFEVVDGHVSRIKRQKTIAPKACSFYVQTELDALVRDCTGSGFPADVKTKEVRCLYLSLAVRQAVLSGSPYLFWVTPEVWAFVSKESATVRSKLS